VNSETDFVARNKEFQAFVSLVATTVNRQPCEGELNVDELLHASLTEGQPLADHLLGAVTQIRENLIIRRACNITLTSSQVAGIYVHGKVTLFTSVCLSMD
jgi:translation elongation factor EF-Ts